VVSNGPGDPAAVAAVPETIRHLLDRVPVLGICLGHQLLALALGGKTYKLRFGHHGANHPVRDEQTGAVWITSQKPQLRGGPILTAAGHPRVHDQPHGRVGGGHCCGATAGGGYPIHPEAGPGPHDALGVFARFVWRCGRRVTSAAAGRPPQRLRLGAGPIRIGQACEFDYSGVQGCRPCARKDSGSSW